MLSPLQQAKHNTIWTWKEDKSMTIFSNKTQMRQWLHTTNNSHNVKEYQLSHSHYVTWLKICWLAQYPDTSSKLDSWWLLVIHCIIGLIACCRIIFRLRSTRTSSRVFMLHIDLHLAHAEHSASSRTAFDTVIYYDKIKPEYNTSTTRSWWQSARRMPLPGHECTHIYKYVQQTDGQPKNITPAAQSIGWAEAILLKQLCA